MASRIVGRVFERVFGSAPRKSVMLCLAEHANPDTELAFPSVARIALETELGESTVRTALGWLRKAQILVLVAPARQHRPATYRIDLRVLAGLSLVEVYQGSDLSEQAVRAGSDLPLPVPSPAPDLSVGALRPLAPGPESQKESPEVAARKGPRAALPPAIAVFRRVANVLPRKFLWPMIVKQVGSKPADVDRLAQVLQEWIARAYRPTNITGILDVFKHGWKTSSHRPNGSRPPAGYDPAADVAAYRQSHGVGGDHAKNRS